MPTICVELRHMSNFHKMSFLQTHILMGMKENNYAHKSLVFNTLLIQSCYISYSHNALEEYHYYAMQCISYICSNTLKIFSTQPVHCLAQEKKNINSFSQ